MSCVNFVRDKQGVRIENRIILPSSTIRAVGDIFLASALIGVSLSSLSVTRLQRQLSSHNQLATEREKCWRPLLGDQYPENPRQFVGALSSVLLIATNGLIAINLNPWYSSEFVVGCFCFLCFVSNHFVILMAV